MWEIILLLLAVGTAIYWLKKSRQSNKASVKTHPSLGIPTLSPPKKFTPIKCAQCNPYEPCSAMEEYFCKTVLKQSKAKEWFHGQHWMQSERGTYRLDFSIILPGEISIAVEIDGYGSHAGDIPRKKFDRERSRQNQLNLHGWKILRFSVDQIKNNPKRCMLEIDNCMEGISLTNLHADKETSVSEYIEFKYVKKELYPFLEKIGAKYSGFRNAWHLPFGCTSDELNALPVELQPIRWRLCIYCEGEAVQRTRKDDGRKFWACQACNKTFNSISGRTN